MHPKIGEIVKGIIRQKRFVYLCTNALLYKKAMKDIPPSPYFAFVVHLDGLRETHDIAVERKGVYDVAITRDQGIPQGRIPRVHEHDAFQRQRAGGVSPLLRDAERPRASRG